jgi:hypothetical protein
MTRTECPISQRAEQIGSYGALLLHPWAVIEAIRERTPPGS